MSKKIIELLSKLGPMLSGDLEKNFQLQYNVSNQAARQALSRANNPVSKIRVIPFSKNQKFCYLESQFKTTKYIECLLNAIKEHSRTYYAYIAVFINMDGYISKNMLPIFVSSPIINTIGHKTHERIIMDLVKCGIVQEFDSTRWMLTPQVAKFYFADNLARSSGFEVVLKQIIHDFAKWASKSNLVGFSSHKIIKDDIAEFAHFQWAFTAPSYVQPLYNMKEQKPGFIIADIFYWKKAEVVDIKFFLDKINIIRSFKNLYTFLPILIVNSVSHEALEVLKQNKIAIIFIDNMFGKKYLEFLKEIVYIFERCATIINKNPSKVENLFSELAKSEGRYNDIIGDMFELLVGYYYHQIGVQRLYIKKIINIQNTARKRELDVLVERDGKIIVVECKATKSMLGKEYIEKWLSTNVPQTRDWLIQNYSNNDLSLEFQLWSLGGFSEESLSILQKAKDNTRKYSIDFFDKKDILRMAKEKKVQCFVDILQQHFLNSEGK